MALSEKEQQQINTLVRRFESDTGIEAVAAVVGKADAYPEIPWKAYAIGSALGALTIALFPLLLSDWNVMWTLTLAAMVMLGAGAILAMAASFFASIGRLFLDRVRAEGEARQYAMAMFVDREIFCTQERRALLVLVSTFERVVVILPDRGLRNYAPPAELDRIADAMRRQLLSQGVGAAFEAGFDALQTLMRGHGFSASPGRANVLDDGVIAEGGA